MRSAVHFCHFKFMGIALCLTLAVVDGALAATRQEMIDACKRSVGRPIVLTCMKGAGATRDACFDWRDPRSGHA